MNKEKLKTFLKSKKMKKLLIYIGIAIVGIAAVVGVAIFMGAAKLTVVSADPTVSDRCSALVNDELSFGTNNVVRSCDCNVIGAIRRKQGKTAEIHTHNETVLLEGFDEEFDTLAKEYRDFMTDYVIFAESKDLAPGSNEYTHYKDFYKQAVALFKSGAETTESDLLPVTIAESEDFSKSVIIGINGEFCFTFGTNIDDAEIPAAQLNAANLFGFDNLTDFRKYAHYTLVDDLEDYLANGINDDNPFNPLYINGAIITEGKSLILPYVIVNDATHDYILACVVYDKATGTIAVWFNDIDVATALLANDGAVVTLYGRCGLFEKARSVSLAAGSVKGGGRYTSGSKKTIKATPNPGFEFRNWTNPDGSVASTDAEYTLEIPQAKLTLTANWNVTKQKLILHVTDTVTEIQEFTVLSDTLLISEPNPEDYGMVGYTFIGWEHKLVNLLGIERMEPAKDYVESGTIYDVELYAKWAKSANITYYFKDGDGVWQNFAVTNLPNGYNNPENPSSFILGEALTIKDPTKETGANDGGKYVFDGWYLDEACLTKLTDSTIPATQDGDVTLYAKWSGNISYYNLIKTNGVVTHVELGSYPQTRLDDPRTIMEIKSSIASGATQVDEETGIFIFGNTPYLRTTASPYQANTYFSDGTLVEEETEYFFIIEPIRWRVLSGNPEDPNSEVVLVSESVLDSSVFHSDLSARSIDGKAVYANNWEFSDIREWLNGEFLAEAFKEGELARIQETTVDYGKDTAHYPRYANGGKTTDLVYLLSYTDLINEDYGWSDTFTSEDDLKMAKATDYAKARGTYVSLAQSKEYLSEHDSAHWWLRSPGDFADSAALTTAPGTLGTYKVNCESIGVRPAITVKLGAIG